MPIKVQYIEPAHSKYILLGQDIQMKIKLFVLIKDQNNYNIGPDQ